MLVEYLEEDFRFATGGQVAAYSSEELRYKPHINGFDLSQLFDQLDGHIIASRAAGRRFQVLIQAPGGTALCIAEHMTPHETENDFFLEFAVHLTNHYDQHTFLKLHEMPHVTSVFHDLSVTELPPGYYAKGCIVLADAGQDRPRNLMRDGPELLIVHDPEQSLGPGPGCNHFMGSNIWVKRGN